MQFFPSPKFLLIVDGVGISHQGMEQNPRRHTLLIAIVRKLFDQGKNTTSMGFQSHPVDPVDQNNSPS